MCGCQTDSAPAVETGPSMRAARILTTADGKEEKLRNPAGAQSMFAEYLQHVRKQRDAGAKEDEADYIERIGFLAVIRQMPVDHVKTGEANRQIHEKDDAPVQIPDDQAAGDGSEHRADQPRDGDEAHGADK